MSITLRSGATYVATRASAGNINFPIASSVVNGDFMLLMLTTSGTPTFNALSGWTVIKDQAGVAGVGHLVTLTRIANNESLVAFYNAILASGTANLGVSLRVYTSSVGSPITYEDIQGQTQTSATDTAPSVLISHVNELVVYEGIWFAIGDPVTAPTGFSNIIGTTNNSPTFISCDKDFGLVTGASGNVTGTAAASGPNIGVLVSLYEVTGSGTPVAFAATASFTVSTNQSYDNTKVSARASFSVAVSVSTYLSSGRYRY